MSRKKAAAIATMIVSGIIGFFALALYVASLLGDVGFFFPIFGLSVMIAMVWYAIYAVLIIKER